MSLIPLEKIVRGAIANKGHDTLHLFVVYLHWAFAAINKYQREGVFTEIRYTKDYLDENNAFPFPSDMLMWNKVGIIENGRATIFVNDDAISLHEGDQIDSSNAGIPGLFAYDSSSLDVLYTTNIYVGTSAGTVQVNFANQNTFRANWRAKKFQIGKSIPGKQLYVEYVAKAHDPSTQTLINELATEYIEHFIYYREARFKFGAAHRETRAAEQDWLNEQDELRASLSDLTADGLLSALYQGTRKSIDQ